MDERVARYYNTDLAEYLIPVNADVPDVRVNAAIANAVYHATGVRIRELPIRIEKLLGPLISA